ncbi:MAG: tRNA (adenosine(37)-N6)-threonylcarbamoyltransferase complex ATPase subunit type 1 TsaE [Chitinophagaceae bacterium]|nr:tRNA (adenosine(37)-N6)-threonylcarbamoyltransferase complex ATPase subunit type 1 TsaE [Chitinophagaceae bacterium]
MELAYAKKDIDETAKMFWEQLPDKKVLAFHGEMGVGKTTFIQALCRVLGVSAPVSSPTFSIINEYDVPEGSIYHIDLYRCRDENEAIRAGVEECLYSGYICLVEWPSKAPGIFPEDTLHIYMEETEDRMRRIRM